jgi:hypothetical protein
MGLIIDPMAKLLGVAGGQNKSLLVLGQSRNWVDGWQ